MVCAAFGDLKLALAEAAALEDRHLHALFRFYDSECSGSVNISQLMGGIFGTLDSRRLALVKLAFAV